MRPRCLLSVVLCMALATGCEDNGDVGSQCIFGTGTGLGGGTRTEDNCNEGLYCSTSTGTCRAPFAAGAVCDRSCNAMTSACNDRCEDGLICDLTSTCQPPGEVGARCADSQTCAEGLECNHGYLPNESAFGECREPSPAGAPCSYTQYSERPSASRVGCAAGLTCMPSTPTYAEITSGDPRYTCSDPTGTLCGYPGVCAAGHTAVAGEGCLDDNNCVDGTECYVVGHPKAPMNTPGFACMGVSQDCYLGPWTGLCGPPGLVVRGGVCTLSSQCAPGTLCNRNGICVPRWSQSQNEKCTEFQLDAPVDDLCMIGLRCRVGSEPRCAP